MTHLNLILENCLKRTNSFTRFLLVGVLNTLVGLSLIFILLNLAGFNYWAATFIGNGTGAIVSFLLNRAFTFQSGVSFKKGGPLFFMVIISCYFSSYAISEWISSNIHSQMLPISQQHLAVALGTCIYTVSNFTGQKFIVFSK
ncbi:GtrA family protein [Bacillus sp. V5-8f]|uniref:GtrA family protein n=1 Tax=Bacillus sp. V5-8f TaxID=2053044 RepID=UPI000C790D96|nr:GtrA family protein [Bacillus sp. V5-8f]PLT35590.1 polysaccharide biosynthesis protein GtrA [Bacillus sp. V5-8f]